MSTALATPTALAFAAGAGLGVLLAVALRARNKREDRDQPQPQPRSCAEPQPRSCEPEPEPQPRSCEPEPEPQPRSCEPDEYFKCLFFGGNKACLKMDQQSSTCTCALHGEQEVLAWLGGARYSVDLCIMTVTLDSVGAALARLSKAGVRVRVIMDRNMIRETNSVYQEILRSDLESRCVRYNSDLIMHHKFIIRDAAYPNRSLLNGSVNFTMNGVLGVNYENIMITNRADVVREFTKEFNSIWNSFIDIKTRNIAEDEKSNIPGDFKFCEKRPRSQIINKVFHQKKEDSPKPNLRKKIDLSTVDRW